MFERLYLQKHHWMSKTGSQYFDQKEQYVLHIKWKEISTVTNEVEISNKSVPTYNIFLYVCMSVNSKWVYISRIINSILVIRITRIMNTHKYNKYWFIQQKLKYLWHSNTILYSMYKCMFKSTIRIHSLTFAQHMLRCLLYDLMFVFNNALNK